MKIFSILLVVLLAGCERTVYPDTPPPLVGPLPQYEGNNAFLSDEQEEPYGWRDDEDDVGGD